MDGLGGGLVYSNFESASAEMDPDHPLGRGNGGGGGGGEDMLSSQHSSYHHQENDQQHYSSYLMDTSGDGTADFDLNYTGEAELLWANETQQCWWNGSNEVCILNDTNILYPDYYTDMYSLGFKVAIAILYNSIFVTALLGNALVCYVVFSSPRMRTVTNYLIANLAVGDLLMALLCVPFSYVPVLLQYWPFGQFLCYLLSPAQAISVFVSSYTLVALAVDRYMAILYPLRPRFRRSQACWVIAVVWLIAIITASPIAIFTEYYPDNTTGLFYCEESGWKSLGAEKFKLPYGLTLMILQYFFPLTVLIFTYSRIAMAVWGKKSLGEAEDSRDQRLAKTKRKMIKMMLTVVFVYTISWLPFNIFLIYGDIWHDNLYLENLEVVSYIYPIIHWLAMAHSVWNPVIYCYMNSRFREGFRAAISNVPCIWKMMRFCQLPKSRRSHSSGIMTDSTRRRMSYYSHSGNTRLTRTNTTCTTYTFGSGSLHNIHNTITNNPGVYHHNHQHHNYAMNNPLVMRKHSYLPVGNGNGSNINLNGRGSQSQRPSISSVGSTQVSQYPKPNQLNIASSAPSVGIMTVKAPEITENGRDMLTLKQSDTMTSLDPGQSSSMESSPSSPGRTASLPNNDLSSKNMPAPCLKQVVTPAVHVSSNGTDLIVSCNNNDKKSGKKKVSLSKVNSNGNGVAKSQKSNSSSPSSSPVIQNSSSYVSVCSKGGKEVVTTKAIATTAATTAVTKGKSGKGKAVVAAAATTNSSSTTNGGAGGRSFLNRKRSSNSSGVSESFM